MFVLRALAHLLLVLFTAAVFGLFALAALGAHLARLPVRFDPFGPYAPDRGTPAPATT